MNRGKLKPGPKKFARTSKKLYCWNCKKETEWHFLLGYVNYHGVVPCLECIECGENIPAFAIKSYNDCGVPAIPR